jgi:hypothetical protein
MLSNSQRLRGKIAMVDADLTGAAGRVWLHPRLRELFPELLFTVHQVTRATAPSMRAAAEAAEKLIGCDPIAAPLHEYLAEHTIEETGHDIWTLDDLRVLGYPVETVLERIPSSAVAALVGSQYYWTYHFHPVAYLSYVAVLEGPQTLEFIDAVIERTGLPRDAFSTHIIHAKLDIHHVKAFDEFLDRLPLTERHHEILGVNAIATVAMLQRVFEELADRFDRNSGPATKEAARHETAVLAGALS